MRDYQKVGKLRRVMQSKIALFALGFVIIFFSYTIFNLLQKMEETKKNKEIAQSQVEELEQRKAKLSEDIASLKTEEGVEASIRSRFGFAQEGESMIVIVEDEENQGGAKKNNRFLEFFTGWWK